VAVYRGKGIVLRSIRYGEADRILDLYTSDRGLVSAIAKGIRRTKSKFGARLEPLSCVDFLAYEGRSLDTITQAETLRSFHRVREDLPRLTAAGSLVSTARALSGGDEADRRVFNLLFHALDALDSREGGHAGVEAAFGLKLSVLAGYAPKLDACALCGRELDAVAEGEGAFRYAPSLGGALCPDCRASDAFPVPPGTVGALRDLLARPVREAVLDAALGEPVRRVVAAHVHAHAPGASLAAPA
jgi:DNA repair protein RecO (recombination protein O)